MPDGCILKHPYGGMNVQWTIMHNLQYRMMNNAFMLISDTHLIIS